MWRLSLERTSWCSTSALRPCIYRRIHNPLSAAVNLPCQQQQQQNCRDVCFMFRYFDVLDYNGGGSVGMEIDGILDPGMLPMHRSDARVVNVREKRRGCTTIPSLPSQLYGDTNCS